MKKYIMNLFGSLFGLILGTLGVLVLLAVDFLKALFGRGSRYEQ